MLNNLATRLVVKVQSGLVSRMAREEDGATAVEYGLIVGLIAVVIIGVVAALGGKIHDMFAAINTGLTTP